MAFPVLPGDFTCIASCAFPLSGDLGSAIPHPPRRMGIWPPAFPTPLPRGPLQQLEKSSQSAIWRPVFFCTHPFAYKSKLLMLGLSTKKASKRCLKAFFTVAVRGGFEPPVRLPVRQFSKLVVSATHPSHLSAQWVRCLHKRLGLQIYAKTLYLQILF